MSDGQTEQEPKSTQRNARIAQHGWRHRMASEPAPFAPIDARPHAKDNTFEKGLPVSLETEKFLLGSALLVRDHVPSVVAMGRDAWGLEKHRRIWDCIKNIHERGDVPDTVTLADELIKLGFLDSVDGLGFLMTLTDGLPEIPSIESYIKIVLEDAARRKMIFASQRVIDRCMTRQEAPTIIADAMDKVAREARDSTDTDKNIGRSAEQIIQQFPGGISAFMDPTMRPRGLPFPWEKMNELTTGMHAGELIVVAARPRVGKSAACGNIAAHLALNYNKRVHYSSLEMSGESMLTRFMCSIARVDQHKFRSGSLNTDDRHRLQMALSNLVDSPLLIDDRFEKNLIQAERRIKKAVKEEDCVLAIIDQLSLMKGSRKDGNRRSDVSDITRGLKLLSGECGIPVIAVNQIGRSAENRAGGSGRPELQDLKESGCIPGDSLVTMSDGSRVRIDSLVGRAGFEILGLDQSSLKVKPFAVSRVFSSGSKPVYKIQMASGRTVQATANHKFLTINGWLALEGIQIGKHLATPRISPSTTIDESMSRDQLALLAHLIGNGTIVNRQPVHYTTWDIDVAEFVKNTASRMFNTINPHIKPTRGHWDLYFNSTKHHTHGVYGDIRLWLEALGIWDHRSLDKFIPEIVMAQPNDSLAWFIGNLWSTDGCISPPGGNSTAKAYYSTSCERLARDVQHALSRLGIRSRVQSVPQKKSVNDSWHVTINGVTDLALFCNLIPAIGERRNGRLDALRSYVNSTTSNTNLDVIPSDVWRTIIVPAANQQINFSLRKSCRSAIRNDNGIGRDRARMIAEEINSQELEALANSDIYWDRVVSITPMGNVDVFDMTVPGCQNFTANGITLHNSLEEDADIVIFVYREELVKRDRDDLKGKAELIIAKQRNGPEGICHVRWHGAFAKFEDYRDEVEPGQPEYVEVDE